MEHAVKASPEHPILIDGFLDNAAEVDVDAVCDGEMVVIGGIMQHIEEAGIHSGDSACSLPPFSLKEHIVEEIRKQTTVLALELNVIGLINIQFAIQGDKIYVLEVKPRASRTIPFICKATGVPLAKIAARVMAGKSLKELGFTRYTKISHTAVKESVFPFIKFSGVDILLGPEMKSTGEVMGLGKTFGSAFAKAQLSTGTKLPAEGTVFISVKDSDKPMAVKVAQGLSELGYDLIATHGTAKRLQQAGLEAVHINKVKEGSPHIVEAIESGKIDFVINTTFGKQAIKDSFSLRRASLTKNLTYCTTMAGALALVDGLRTLHKSDMEAVTLQEYMEEQLESAP